MSYRMSIVTYVGIIHAVILLIRLRPPTAYGACSYFTFLDTDNFLIARFPAAAFADDFVTNITFLLFHRLTLSLHSGQVIVVAVTTASTISLQKGHVTHFMSLDDSEELSKYDDRRFEPLIDAIPLLFTPPVLPQLPAIGGGMWP